MPAPNNTQARLSAAAGKYTEKGKDIMAKVSIIIIIPKKICVIIIIIALALKL